MCVVDSVLEKILIVYLFFYYDMASTSSNTKKFINIRSPVDVVDFLLNYFKLLKQNVVKLLNRPIPN